MASAPPPGAEGLEPIEAAGPREGPGRRARGDAGIRLSIRGRSIQLRRLRRPPPVALRWLFILGPGLIASSAGNDAGGIATYAATGAQYGYDLIWVMVVVTISLAVVQELCARLGAATGRGLFDLIRERFGLGWSLLAIAAILIANGGLAASEFVGIGAASELLGIGGRVAIPVAAVLVWSLVVFGSYSRAEKVFLAMTLVFFAYPVAAVLGHPDWSAVARGAFVPTFHRDPDYLFLMVALIGTTITPYMQLFQQSSIVERWGARKHYGPERADVYLGVVFSNLMSIAIIVATAATLHRAGHTRIETAADAAKALAPIAGAASEVLFAVGLLGASLLAAAVLSLATAYAVSEAFGLLKGVDLDFRRAPGFFVLFTIYVVLGALCALIPNLPVMRWLVGVQVLNGLLLPVFLACLLRLANDGSLMGDLKNTRWQSALGWGSWALVTIAIVAMLGAQFLSLIGVHVFHAS